MNLAFLVQMGWKSAIIAGAALVVLKLLRSRSAADRAAVLQLTVVTLLLLPAISLALPSLQIAQPLAVERAAPAPTALSPRAAEARPAQPGGALPSRPAPAAPRRLPIAPALALVYGAGVLLLGARMAAGLSTLDGWTRRGRPIASPEWTAALARAKAAARIDRRLRLLASDEVPSPMSWGLLRPVILIDRDSLARAEDIDAILAHETAHVVRRDWLVLMLSRLAVTLFWFNPLVWLLERALVQEAEEAADRHAIERVEPLRYASTLVACVRHARGGGVAVPANGIVPASALKRRVEAILDQDRRRTASGSLLTGGAMVLCVALSAPVAALELVPAKAAPPAPGRLAAAERAAPARPAGPAIPDRPLAVQRSAHPAAASPAAAPDVADAPDAPDAPDPEDHADDNDRVQIDAGALADLARLGPGLVDIHINPQIDVHIPNIAAQVMREVSRDLSRDLKHDLSRDLGRDLARDSARGPRGAGDDRMVESQIFGITDADRREYSRLGYPNLAHKQLIEMAVHHVSPGFIRDMAAAGYPGLTPQQLVKMRIFGISPETARRAAASLGRPPPEALIKMKILGAL